MLQTVDQNDRWVARWLIVCAAVIFGMILLGGVTRLTDSGLSMVEWKPILGIVPPLNEAEWQVAFDKYKQYPEFQKVNHQMDLEGFKYIFMYEYLHRVLGRLIGMLFFFPLVFFALRGMIKQGLMPKLLGLLVLGGCQGLMGWFMVKSGLIDRPDVSQYRLTAHLGLAVLIYGYMVWLILDLGASHRSWVARLPRWPLALVGVVFFMILTGGFVAGTDAGFVYPTWPMMGETFTPPGLYEHGAVSAFEHVPTIQFNHRMLAYLVLVLVIATVARTHMSNSDKRSRRAASFLGLAVIVQVMLGISTLLTHVQIPVAAAHQGGAIVLFTAVLAFAHARLTRAHE